MERPSPARRPLGSTKRRPSTQSAPDSAILLAQLQAWAERENRRRDRAAKRERMTASYHPNGKREVARRLRQIAAGQLRISA
ncbi:MAG: hypothetical protein HXX10_07465 [Rhodoplanes sp.]|uniref:hypothetical protein n=1 Tax=Rhodoplanes sp. TaxID=1968906 RepID=UPI00184F9130|nr:hypothetical protein [Rhodoplanes sp.]NVO13858.1 hypothetical protein [Rhodoplanes sp.]